MAPSLTRSGDELEVSLSGLAWGGELEAAREQIKQIAGRRWDPERKLWCVPLDVGAAERIVRTVRPKMDKATEEWFRSERAEFNERVITPLPEDADLKIPWARQRCDWQPEEVNDVKFEGLLDYQRAAVDYMARYGRFVLGDDMGLGKTLMALSAVKEWQLRNPMADGRMHDGPKLIVCPNSVKASWLREIRRWLPPEEIVYVLDGTAKKRHEILERAIQEDAWVITNWDQVRVEKRERKTRAGGTVTEKVMKEPLYTKTKWLTVIADEVHRMKNYRAKQTLGMWRIMRNSEAGVQYGLTGTSIQNAPNELWPILRWLWPEQYNTNGTAEKPKIAYWYFYNQYVESYEDPNGRDVVIGVKQPDKLRFELKNRLIRRTAGETRALPGHRRIFYPVELLPAQRKLYQQAEKAMWLEIKQKAAEGDTQAQRLLDEAKGNTSSLVRIANGATRVVRLKQIIETPALLGGPNESALAEDLAGKIGDSRPNQWVIFTEYNDTPDYLAEYLTHKTRFPGLNIGLYTGKVNSTIERGRLEDRFQSGHLDMMIGTYASMREGITLTAAHLGYWMTRAWVPDWNEQGEMRYANRMGQQKHSTTYIPLAMLDAKTPTVASTKIQTKNKIKEGIVRAVLPKDEIEEVHR